MRPRRQQQMEMLDTDISGCDMNDDGRRVDNRDNDSEGHVAERATDNR